MPRNGETHFVGGIVSRVGQVKTLLDRVDTIALSLPLLAPCLLLTLDIIRTCCFCSSSPLD